MPQFVAAAYACTDETTRNREKGGLGTPFEPFCPRLEPSLLKLKYNGIIVRNYTKSMESLINPYEIISKSALPAFRAMVAKRLTTDYRMTQQQVAVRLGVTQASVSNDARKARGTMLNLEVDSNLAKAADQVAAILASEHPDQREALRLMTEVCDYIRFNHVMCRLHQDLEPGFNAEGCAACVGGLSIENTRIRLNTAA